VDVVGQRFCNGRNTIHSTGAPKNKASVRKNGAMPVPKSSAAFSCVAPSASFIANSGDREDPGL
jgi:hypothetical protein